jgi:hypothetical protein
MSKILYHQPTNQIVSYNRLDNELPVGLDYSVYLVLDQISTDPPGYDEETQIVTSSWVIDVENLEYRQEWIVSDKPEPEPVPNWDGFNAAMLTNVEFNTYYGAGLTTAPAVTTSIPTALAQVSTNGINAFALTFNGFCQAVSVTSTHRGEWADLAETLNLPADFAAVVRG